MNSKHEEKRDSANAAGIVLVLQCRSCGKQHRVKELPRDTGGGAANDFLFNCIACGKTEIRTRADIFQQAASPRQQLQLIPSRSP